MTGTPQYSAAQLLDIASRYELEGNLEYANQFYRYLAENLVGTPEAAQARAALERLAQRQASQRDKAPPLKTEPERGPQWQQAGGRAQLPPQSAAQRAEPTLSTPSAQQRPRETSQPGYPGRSDTARPAPAQHPQFATPKGSPPATAGPYPNQPNLSAHADDDNNTPLPRVVRGEEEEVDDGVEFVPGYRVGRFLAFTMVLVGWLALIGGIVFAGLAIAGVAGSQIMAEYGGLPFGVLIGLAGLAAGLLMIFLGSMAQAAYEAANNTRELLEIERAKAGW